MLFAGWSWGLTGFPFGLSLPQRWDGSFLTPYQGSVSLSRLRISNVSSNVTRSVVLPNTSRMFWTTRNEVTGVERALWQRARDPGTSHRDKAAQAWR
ncbi:uncharacterized protein BCR38DRAFT_450244 [Pseudomassariella vexata]|uniref:Uncharacterized protein n=1 Tax=Pseudomassariella vexata TaxID=1141098 RepID=A0A1Y2DC85_9PEZI|nr:uncharacterized protein BCR38DRAFT_450244 [Pseudomassariella vexata]ORY56868.1 hypothetical protein BCR38DRAFT_450244 [Pseudomassariella vexata]